MVKSGQVWKGLIVTKDATGTLSAATVGPAGTLYVDGVEDAAEVSIAGANPYSWSVTLPVLTPGQCVSLYLTATIADVATGEIVAEDVADTKIVSELNDIAAGSEMDLVDAPNATAITAIQSGLAVPGDEMALTTSERSSIVSAVWDALTSELTADDSVGKLLIEKLALLVAGSVTISAPVLPNGNAKTIQGDDYLLEDGRALEWAVSTTADLPDAEIAVILGGLTTFEAEMVGDKAARLELTRTETAAIPVGNHDFAIVATRKNGDVITLLEGRWRSTRRIVAP